MKAKTAATLSRLFIDGMDLDAVQKHKSKLETALREARAEFGFEQAVQDGYMVPVASESATGFVPKQAWLEHNLQHALIQANKRELDLLAESGAIDEALAHVGFIPKTDEPTRVNTATQSFDMQELINRRFMFNPNTGTLLLGRQYYTGKAEGSHLDEYRALAPQEPFDNFIRGWVGTSVKYDNGIIHFAPPIRNETAEQFGEGLSAIEMFARNGANDDTVIRAFPGSWEQPLSAVIGNDKFKGKESDIMNDNNAPPDSGGSHNQLGDGGGALTPPNNGGVNTANELANNEYVQQLFSILQENGKSTKGLSALLGHVSDMESFVKRAEDKISVMKDQLAELKEAQGHPVRTALENAIKKLEHTVAVVKERIAELKQNIVEGCKAAVEAFKEKGAAALNNLARFFHIKQGLTAISKDCAHDVKVCDKAIADVNTFAEQYHTAGRALKNMGRMFVGKDPIDEKKEAGKLAKAVSAPYKAEKAALTCLKNAADKAVASLERMEERQAARKAERAKKPSALGELEESKVIAAEFNRGLETRDRALVHAGEAI